LQVAGNRSENALYAASIDSAAVRKLVGQFGEAVLDARQVQTAFVLRRDEALLSRHQALIDTAGRTLDAVDQRLADGDVLKLQLGMLRTSMAPFATQFGNVVAAQKTLGLTEELGLQGRLRTSVHHIEQVLRPLDQPRLVNLMLMLR